MNLLCSELWDANASANLVAFNVARRRGFFFTFD